MKQIIRITAKYTPYGIGMVLLAMSLCSCSKYEDRSPYSASDGLAAVLSKEGKWGYIDMQKKEVIPCIYFSAETFVNGVAIVAKGEKEYGIIDKNGKEILPFKYEELSTEYYAFREGMIKVRAGDKYGVIDRSGKEVLPCNYNEIDLRFNDGNYIQTFSNDGSRIFDYKGKEVDYKLGRLKIININGRENTFSLLDIKTNEKLAFETIIVSVKKKSDDVFAPRDNKKVTRIICAQSGGVDMVRFITNTASFSEGMDYVAFSEVVELKYELLNGELTIFAD